MNKKELRAIYLQKRKNITSSEKSIMDDLLLIQLQHLYFETAKILFNYFPMEHQHEPNTLLYSKYLQHAIDSLQTAYPVIETATRRMGAFIVNEETVFTRNAYGIPEPENGKFIEPQKIDIVFVPLLVCDTTGNRVGFGKGFYDRYLAQCREDVLKIGFSYFDVIDKITDTHTFDIPLSFCITPTEIYEF